jgi:3'-5' exoribonuclease
MDSKMNSLEMIKKTDSSTGNWSGFVKHLDRIVYKSDLPFYPDYISDEEQEDERPEPRKEVPSRPVSVPQSKSRNVPEPKTSMAKMLGNIKIEE